MLPVTTRTAHGRGGVLMPGDYVEITACRCEAPHSRYGIIFRPRMPDGWLVLLASSRRVAEYCSPLELRPAGEDDMANAIPKKPESASGGLLVLARR